MNYIKENILKLDLLMPLRIIPGLFVLWVVVRNSWIFIKLLLLSIFYHPKELGSIPSLYSFILTISVFAWISLWVALYKIYIEYINNPKPSKRYLSMLIILLGIVCVFIVAIIQIIFYKIAPEYFARIMEIFNYAVDMWTIPGIL